MIEDHFIIQPQLTGNIRSNSRKFSKICSANTPIEPLRRKKVTITRAMCNINFDSERASKQVSATTLQKILLLNIYVTKISPEPPQLLL